MKKSVKVLLLLSVSLNLVASDYNASTIVDLANKAMTLIDWDRIDECYWEECDPEVGSGIKVHKIYNYGTTNTSFTTQQNASEYAWYSVGSFTLVQVRYDFNLYYIGRSAFEYGNIREFYYFIMNTKGRCDRYHIAEHFGPNVTAASTSEMKEIFSRAFYKSNLEYMEIGPKVEKIHPEAFGGCDYLRTFVALPTTPPVATDAFDRPNINKCKLVVPVNYISVYKAHPEWDSFGLYEDLNGRSYDDPTSISIGEDVSLKPTETRRLSPALTPLSAHHLVTWTSSDARVATCVDGLITAVASGTATITATTSNGLKNSVQVRVVSSDNKLTALSTSEGTLSPAFRSVVYNYNVTVKGNTSSIIIFADKHATASVAGADTHVLNYGNNTFPVTVTAEDGSILTYTVNVYRQDNNAKLASLESSIPFSPAFDTNICEYKAETLSSQINTVNLQGVPAEPLAHVSGLGIHTLAAVDNTFPVTVTAKDGSTGTYFFSVHRRNNVATLSALTASAGTLSPAFSPSVHNYKLTVPYVTSSTDISATLTDTSGTLLSGIGPHDLSVGDNIITIHTAAEDPAHTATYTVNVYRQSNIALLSTLNVSAGTFSPAFSSAVRDYTLTVPYDTSSVDISATLSALKGTISGTGHRDLAVGDNDVIINVAAEDAAYTNRYNVRIHRQNNEAVLSALTTSAGTLSPPFSPATYSYTLEVTHATSSMDILATLADSKGTLQGNGPHDLSVGDNDVIINVTAEDAAYTNGYNVRIHRQNNDATLSALAASAGTLSPPFSPAIYSYTLEVPNATSSIDLSASLTDIRGRVSGTGPRDITPGHTALSVSAFAEDSTYFKVYVINVYTQSNDATLSSLSTSAGTLSPPFSPFIHNYTLTVPYATSSANISATVTDLGYAQVSGTGRHDLAVGDNTITVNTTAEDHTCTGTYIINARRQNNNTALSALATSAGTLTPAFDPSIREYALVVPYLASKVDILAEADYLVTVSDTGSYHLVLGDNPITINTTAEDPAYTGTYNINAYRLDGVATLRSIAVSAGTYKPDFRSSVHNYVLSLPDNYTLLSVEGIPSSDKATVQGNEAYELDSGLREVCLKVTAEDGSFLYYYLLLDRHTEITSVEKTDLFVNFKNSSLFVHSSYAETVCVYTLSGRLLHTFSKQPGSASYSLSNSEHVWIVRGSSGWVVKVCD